MSTIRLPGDNTNKTLIYKGLVVSDTDTFTGYEPIKCRIQITDGNILKDDDLPRCYPLLPKHINVYPKKGEYVYILMLNTDSQQQIRYYIGPVIDTYKNLPYNPDDNAEVNSPIRPDLKKPEKGIYPKREYVSILGRDNNDIVLKEKEVLIRAGKYVSDNPLKFNSLDTAYIQLRYGQPESKEVTKKVSKVITKLINPEGFVTAKILGNNQYYVIAEKFSLLGTFNLDIRIFNISTSLIVVAENAAGPDSDINVAYTKLVKKVQDSLASQNITGIIIPPLDQFLSPGSNPTSPSSNYIVDIKIEDKNNIFIGSIYKTFNSNDSAVSFVKETFQNLVQNKTSAIKLIKQSNSFDINNNYDFSRFKYINNSIPELWNFTVNKLTEEIKTTEDVTVIETVFNESKGSVINIVSNKLNLISYANKQGFKLLDPDMTITSDQQIKICSEAQPIPYGYVLNEFLGLVKSFVAGHVHAYHGLPPDPDPTVTQILNFDLNLILNENVRTA